MFIKDLCKSVSGSVGLYKGGYYLESVRRSVIRQTSQAARNSANWVESTSTRDQNQQYWLSLLSPPRWPKSIVTALKEEPF